MFEIKENLQTVGQNILKVDAEDKVTGKAVYIDDMVFPDMLYGKTLTSRYPHARLKKIDPTPALKLKGVRAVATAKDIPGENEIGVILKGQPLIAYEKVRYMGDCVALVAADSPEIAAKACQLIKVEYEELPGVFSPLDGLKPEAPKIHPKGNIANHLKLRKGNIEEGFSQADVVIEDTYEIKGQEQGYLETQGTIVVPHKDGNITVYGSLQCPFYVQKAVANCLGLPYNKVRVIQTVTGGGFGGKEDFPSEISARAAVLAVKTKRPVKMILDREEDLLITTKRHAMVMNYKLGATNEGKLCAAEIKIYADCGAYDTLTPVVLFRTNVHAAGGYEIPHVSIDTYGIYTNHPTAGAMRGFGQPQVVFAGESIIDDLAYKLGIDPLDFRLKNCLKEGSLTATNQKLTESVGLVETIEQARLQSQWDLQKKQKKNEGYLKKGIGASTIYYGVSLGSKGWYLEKAGAHLQIWRDGSVNLAIGGTDMGQGAFTVISQIAAETLGISMEFINLTEVSTAYVPDSGPTVASRTTIFSGNATHDAARQLAKKLISTAADMLETTQENIYRGLNYYSRKDNPQQKLTYQQVVSHCYAKNISLSTMGWFSAPYLAWDDSVFQGEAYFVYAYATQIAEVEVDVLTGQVQVVKVTAAHDVGKAINPACIEGQVQGGILQGVGHALYENYILDKGHLLTKNFSTYTMPVSLDAPEVEVIIVEAPYSQGPYGAKGIGEPALIPSSAAVANAIYDAIGFRTKKLPVNPEEIINHCHYLKQ